MQLLWQGLSFPQPYVLRKKESFHLLDELCEKEVICVVLLRIDLVFQSTLTSNITPTELLSNFTHENILFK
jgi:hypothetical protein